MDDEDVCVCGHTAAEHEREGGEAWECNAPECPCVEFNESPGW